MTPIFTIRPFDPEDAEAVAELHRRAILAVSPRFYSRAERESWAHGIDPATYVRIAAQEEVLQVSSDAAGRILGFTGYKSRDQKGEVAGLYTDPEMHGRGIGSALLRTAETDLIRDGVTLLFVRASLAAVAFYERHGYQAHARSLHKTRGGLEIAMWHMEKQM